MNANAHSMHANVVMSFFFNAAAFVCLHMMLALCVNIHSFIHSTHMHIVRTVIMKATNKQSV